MYLLGCGISKINLEGTLEDWEKILVKTNKLRKYELDWWIDEIEPIIKKIISTKKGIIDGDFWIRFIYNEDRFLLKGLSGIMTEKIKAIGGWLLKFYPYLNKGKRKGKLDTIAFETLSKLGSEFLPVRFKVVNVPKNTETDCKIFAGFIGMKQDQESMSVIPEIGWFVCKDDKEKTEVCGNGDGVIL